MGVSKSCGKEPTSIRESREEETEAVERKGRRPASIPCLESSSHYGDHSCQHQVKKRSGN